MSGLRITPARVAATDLASAATASGGLRIGRDLGDGAALVGCLAHERVERDAREERHPDLVRERLTATRAEELLPACRRGTTCSRPPR